MEESRGCVCKHSISCYLFMCTAIFVVVTYLDQDGLYCSEVSVMDVVDNPTEFCTISGNESIQSSVLCLYMEYLQYLLIFFCKVTSFLHVKQE